MRCKCCDAEQTERIWGDYYCSDCCQAIIEARDFTKKDLYRVMGFEDDDVSPYVEETDQ